MSTCASVKKLIDDLRISEEEAKLIRKIWKADNTEQVMQLCPKMYDRLKNYYNTPKLYETKRLAIDIVFETCGVEYLGWYKRGCEHVYYCNAGDTYAATILFIGGRLVTGCWGDLVERNQIEENCRAW